MDEELSLTGASIDADDNAGNFSYIVFGYEVGDETSTPHLQGYCELHRKLRMRGVAALPGFSRARLAVRNGTAAQAATYCKKEGIFFDGGRISQGQGHRSDLDEIREMIVAGSTDVQLAEANFPQWVIHRRSFEAYRNLITDPRNWETKVYVLVGDTGTGKSRVVHSASNNLWCASDCEGRWFDGYCGQEDVLFDDFDGVGATIAVFLKLCDRYPMQVPIKGGFVNWRPRRIFFTSNTAAENWFPSASVVQFAAFRRRVTKYFQVDRSLIFDNNGQIPEFFN